MIPDPRHIANGHVIPTETYSDQPYIVRTDDDVWLCVMTTGAGSEGDHGQHIISLRSTDQGCTWSDPVDVESAGDPESSYAVALKMPGGRIYCFYNFNQENRRWVRADNPPFAGGKCYRVDTQGSFVFKYSDDGGCSWSSHRTSVPVRTFDIDRDNPYHGEIQFFWNVGRPFIHADVAYVPLHKVGGFGEGFMTRSEGVLLASNNLVTEDDPSQICWETLPNGDVGLRAPVGGGPVADEQSFSVLSDGSFYAVYRTIDGHPAESYSRDGGRTWEKPRYKSYADGRPMKHPRAANFTWRCQNGKYLHWYHNHGGAAIRNHPQRRSMAYENRNPVWLSGGVEADGPHGKEIQWSQPEIVLYDDDPFVRISYPDLVQENGKVYLTETQKEIARVHEIDRTLLDGLWGQFEAADQPNPIATDGLLQAWVQPLQGAVRSPDLPVFVLRSATRADHGLEDLRAGFTLDLWVRLDSLECGQILLDNRTEDGRGFCLQITEQQTVELVLNDGHSESRWDSDRGCLQVEKRHHIVAIVDGGPKLILFVVDGVLCDGGDFRQFGWGRYSPWLRGVAGAETLRIGPTFLGEVESVRLYARALRVSEAVGHYFAGLSDVVTE